MRISCDGLWLTVSLFLVSTGNGQQYTRGGRHVSSDTQGTTRETIGIEKVKTLEFSSDTSSERYQYPRTLADDAKDTEDGKPWAPRSLSRSQLNDLLLNTNENDQNQPQPFTTGAATGRGLQQITRIQRTKCDGIRKIVQCKSDIPEETCKQDLVDNGVDIVSNMEGIMFFAICVRTSEEADLVSTLTTLDSIEDDHPRTFSNLPGSGLIGKLQVGEQVIPYGVELVKAPEFWDVYGSRGAGVSVCVIDSGVRASHEDLAGANISGSDVIVGPWNQDDVGHGTHVTGTIAARDNGVGVIGVAPDVSIYMVRVDDEEGRPTVSSLVDSMLACYDAGADIINMSLGGPSASSAEIYASRYLSNLGVLLISSSGNLGDSINFLEFPAGYEDVMSVGAVDDKMRVASFSSYNIHVDIVAPGVEILSLASDSDTGYLLNNGTSFAAPHVAGVAALLWSQFPSLGVDTIRTALTESAKDLGACGYDQVYGSGIVDVMAAAAFLENITNAAPDLQSCLNVQVNVTTDLWGNETTFLITRQGRPKKIYYRDGPFSSDLAATYSIDIPLQDGCYDLILRDFLGDGILNLQPEDPVITVTYAGVEQVSDDDFSTFEKVYTFGNCDRRSLALSSSTTDDCGDGIVDVGEECDDENIDNFDACLNDCTTARCGDGILHHDIEECDDGNNINGDGCSNSCRIEKQVPVAPTCSPGDTLLHVKFEGDVQTDHENSLYLYDDSSPDDKYIWYAERFQFEPSSEYVGYACLKPSRCYRFFFFDAKGNGLQTGGLTLANDASVVMKIRPGDIGTAGNEGITGTYWSESFGPCMRNTKQY